jgi:hypothetical protein
MGVARSYLQRATFASTAGGNAASSNVSLNPANFPISSPPKTQPPPNSYEKKPRPPEVRHGVQRGIPDRGDDRRLVEAGKELTLADLQVEERVGGQIIRLVVAVRRAPLWNRHTHIQTPPNTEKAKMLRTSRVATIAGGVAGLAAEAARGVP